MCSYFSGFIAGFNGAILLVVGGMPVDSDVPVVTSSILRFASPTQFFGGAHRSKVCMRVFIWVSMRLCIRVCTSLTGYHKKKELDKHAALFCF
jgi:hypothetical protein